VTTAPRVGLFGLLGSGNIGNDGSLDAVLAYLRAEHPDAIIDFFCAGPDEVRARYGLPATRLHWNRAEYQTISGARGIVLKGLGKLVDAVRTAAWVRKHDVVIVPGMGVLEATLPLRPWGFPYSMFLLCASGRLFGTKVALISVGANVIKQRATRYLFTAAARLAHYRSYRDSPAREAARRMGVDTSRDEVYPDLVFALPVPEGTEREPGTVGVGVMDYHGGNDDRASADTIYANYLATLKRFVRSLIDDGRRVRLLTGDESDQSVVREILADVDPSRVVAEPVSSLAELMEQIAVVDVMVATRYHNVLCALKLCKPTVSLGYARKNDVLMAEMGLAEFCQPAQALDFDRLVEQFTTVESRSQELRAVMVERNVVLRQRLEHQFKILSDVLFSGRRR
jgi:polysaccharide pyruvyl transferase WcaK-like protein